MTARTSLGVNILRHEQHWSRRGRIHPMGTPAPHCPILPMASARRWSIAKLIGGMRHG